MITEKMKQIMQQIKELDPEYEIITDKEIEESIKECKKEIPDFELTDKEIEKNLREYLTFLSASRNGKNCSNKI